MLGNLATLVVTSFVSIGTFFSPTPKIISPIPQVRAVIQHTKPHITTVKKITKLALIPSPTETPSPTPLPTETPTPTATPTETPSPIPTATPTSTPSPTPIITITPTPQPSGSLSDMFTNYANHYSVDRGLLERIASCESGERSDAVNGPYGGMYQFSESSWASARAAMGMDPNPELRFNAEESIRTAAFKLSTGGRSAWPNCG